VDEAVRRRNIAPGKYLVLSLDLSRVLVEQDNIDAARGSLIGGLNDSLSEFVSRYRQYLDLASVDLDLSANDPARSFSRLIHQVNRELLQIHENCRGSHDENPLLNVQGVRLPNHVFCYLSNSLQIYLLIDEYDAFANRYMDPHNTSSLAGDHATEVLTSFLAAVKYGFSLEYGVKRVFMTGVTPLLLSSYTSGFNIADNVSYLPSLSDFCGLTRSEVSESLEVICNDEGKRLQHLDELAYHANGYLFATGGDTSPVFSTQTTIDYLNVISPRSRAVRYWPC